MSFEIERKFLVEGDFKSQAYQSSRIRQGYITTAGNATVRVRIRDDKGYLTIAGRVNRNFFIEKFCYGKTGKEG